MKSTSSPPYRDLINLFTHIAWIPGETHGLENMMAVSKLLGNPEKKFRSIHVAGTNGKGSVSLKVAKSLEYSNYRCGLFTSPHISTFRERIRIGDDLITEEEVATFLSEIIEISRKEQIPLTYFEYCTLLAFQYFAKKQVDVAVIEVGLGGRLDATNIIDPILSIITSISKDHTELLGSTEEMIATEKAGIIKPWIPVVIGPRTPATVFEQIAREKSAPLTQVSVQIEHYDRENQRISQEAIRQLQSHFTISPDAITSALLKVPSCRFEHVPVENLAKTLYEIKGTVILDVAHNPNGIERLIDRLKENYPGKNLHFAFNFSTNKDITSCVELISAAAKTTHVLDVNHPRLIAANEIKKLFVSMNDSIGHIQPSELFEKMTASMTGEDILVICGSFFIMGPVRTLLGYTQE